MADTELIKKSVTKGDYPDNPREAIWNFIVPFGGSTLSAGALPPEPPYYWTVARDLLLRSTPLYEDMWAGAVQIATVKATALAWEVDSEVPLRAKRAQELLLDSNWVQFIAKHIRDYLTTDNGTFVEVVRATSSASSRIMGIVHLDSLRCTRTGDPDIPVIYRDKMGREHEMKSHQVFMMSDLPDPGEMFFGVGLCAASRSYRAIYKLHVMDRYIGEKVSGRRPLAIHFVNAVGPRQLESVVVAAEENAARQGILSYMGAIVVPLLDADKPPEVSTIPLAELPDRFNRKEEFDIALLTYADNIGLDPQDLQPLTGQALGTGAQSAVLDEKSKGRVLATWRQEFTHNINEYLLDELTSFAFIEHDYRDMERKAGISNQRADASKKRIEAGITTPAQELQVLVDDDELPKEFLPEDATGDSLSDTEKPDQEAAEQAEGQDEEMPEEQPEAEPKPDETPAKAETKALQEIGELIAQEQDEAQDLYRKAIGENITEKHLPGLHDQSTHGSRGGDSEDQSSDPDTVAKTIGKKPNATYRGISREQFGQFLESGKLTSDGRYMDPQAGKKGELQTTDSVLQAVAHARGGVVMEINRRSTASKPQFADIRKVKSGTLTTEDIFAVYDANTGKMIWSKNG